MKKGSIVLVTCVLLLGITCFAHGQEKAAVVSFQGDVKILPKGEAAEVAPEANMLLNPGDMVTTGKGSLLVAAFDASRHNILRIDENSRVIIRIDGPDRIELVNGDISLSIKDLGKGEEFRIKTPCAVCGAMGTGWETKTTQVITTVSSFEDRVFVQGINPDGTVREQVFWVEGGFERSVDKFMDPGEMVMIPGDRLVAMQNKMKSSVPK